MSIDQILLANPALKSKLESMSSDEIASYIIGIVVLIVSALVYWIYFYRRERTVTARCRKSLQGMFQSNNGDMWVAKYRDQWMSSSPLSKWAGVVVVDQGVGDVVTEINMRDNKNCIGTCHFICIIII